MGVMVVLADSGALAAPAGLAGLGPIIVPPRLGKAVTAEKVVMVAMLGPALAAPADIPSVSSRPLQP